MNNFKKVLAGLLAVSCILSTASCSGIGGEKKPNTAKPQTADQVIQKSYQAIELDSESPLNDVDSLNRLGDTDNVLVTGRTEDGESKMYLTNTEFLTYEEVPFQLPEVENGDSYLRTAVTNNGTIFVLVTTTDYGDVEQPDYDDPDFDFEAFDFDALSEAAVTTHKLYTIDEQGSVLSENDITGLDKYADDSEDMKSTVYINDFIPAGDDKIIISVSGMKEMTYLYVGSDGVVSEPLDFGEDTYLYASCTDLNGNFAYISYDGSKNVIKTMDCSTMKLTDEVITLEDSTLNFNQIIKGNGDYFVYISSTTSLYGVKADGTMEEVINWIDSDLSGDFIRSVLPVEDGDFIVFEQNWSDGSSNFYRLTKRDSSELANMQIINMAMSYSDSEVVEKIKAFNKSSKEYRIKIEDYNSYYEWDEEKEQTVNTPEKQLKQDIAAGKNFDIICINGNSNLFSNLANKGAMVDLYEYMGKDGSVAKEDILPAILSVGEVNGKLISISPSCYIDTYAAKTKFCDKENWTVDDMIETYDSLPKGMKLFSGGNSKEDVFNTFLFGSTSFIDYVNGTCSFDSPDFIKILEFCNQFENAGEGGEIDWKTATDDMMDDFWQDQMVACRNDKALLSTVYFDDMRGYARALHGDFGDDITLVGYPSSDGNGARLNTNMSYGIMASSPNKDVCWDFISQFFTEEYQTSDRMYAIPALMSAFEKKLDDAMKKPYYIDPETNKKVEYEDLYYINDENIEIPPLTKKERDYLEQYILNTKASGFYYDEDVYNIINEEVKVFFAGEKTAQETAKLIQNRISILVSEQA